MYGLKGNPYLYLYVHIGDTHVYNDLEHSCHYRYPAIEMVESHHINHIHKIKQTSWQFYGLENHPGVATIFNLYVSRF